MKRYIIAFTIKREPKNNGTDDDSYYELDTIPSEEIISKLSPDKLREVYQRVRELLERYEYYFGVYNVSDMKPMDSEEDVEDIIKRSL